MAMCWLVTHHSGGCTYLVGIPTHLSKQPGRYGISPQIHKVCEMSSTSSGQDQHMSQGQRRVSQACPKPFKVIGRPNLASFVLVQKHSYCQYTHRLPWYHVLQQRPIVLLPLWS